MRLQRHSTRACCTDHTKGGARRAGPCPRGLTGSRVVQWLLSQVARRTNERAVGRAQGLELGRRLAVGHWGRERGAVAWRCPRARSRDPDRAVWSKASQPTAAGSRAERSGGSRMAEAVGAVALIAAPARRRWLWSVLAAMLGLLTARISALEVHTPKEIFVVNGTQGKLTCTFDSPNTTGWLTTVSWSFQPDGTDSAVSFFHYSQGQVYIGDYPPFKDRVTWAGDLDKKDASINIENIQAVHNGTYICDVKNPPDIVVRPGHIRLHVVEIDNLLVFLVWVVVGTVTAVVLGLTLLISLVLVVLYRRKHSKRDYTGCSTSERLSPVKQAPRKCPSDTEGLVKSPPSAGSHQGPVIYAQLDHSGGHHSGKINKSESVVYADIRKD